MFKNKKINRLSLKILIIFVPFLFIINSHSQDIGLGVTININLTSQTLNSYTPLFYEGKPLPGEGADIKVLANVDVNIPGGSFDSSKLFYSWTLNDYVSHTYTKTGGNIMIFSLDPLVTENVVDLKVYSDNRLTTLLGEKQLKLRPRPTKTILYKDFQNPIITYANAMNKKYESYKVSPNDSFNIIAEPFYFTAKSAKDSSLGYTWVLNNIPGNMDNSNIFYYTAPSKNVANFGIGIKVSNSTKILQASNENINLILGN